MDWKWLLGIPSALIALVSGGYGVEQHFAKQDDIIVLQIQSYEFCIKIIEDLTAQIAQLPPGSPARAELIAKRDYYRKVCGMK